MTPPYPEPTPAPRTSDPADVVVRFLRALTEFDVDTALDLVADDLVYVNVSLPTITGGSRLERIARPWLRPGTLGFKSTSTTWRPRQRRNTDRIDELNCGRFASRFWVYGRFVVGRRREDRRCGGDRSTGWT